MYFYVNVSRVTRASEIKVTEALFAFKIDHTHKNEFKSYFFSCSSEKEMKVCILYFKFVYMNSVV